MYNKPPIPFLGNKKNQLKNIKEVISNMKYDGLINDSTIIYDVFGGSGLVSHVVKTMLPNNRVIWNDYDNYTKRLEIIDITEEIRVKLIKVIGYYNDGNKRDSLLTQEQKEVIKNILNEYDEKDIDFITISSYVAFGGRYYLTRDELYKNFAFNRISKTPLNAKGYLNGFERISKDFKEILQEAKEVDNKLLILDPPYLQTIYNSYVSHFALKDFLYLMENIKGNYILFSSEKSDILVFLEFMSKYNKDLANYTFNDAKLNKINVKADADYIIYKRSRGLFGAI